MAARRTALRAWTAKRADLVRSPPPRRRSSAASACALVSAATAAAAAGSQRRQRPLPLLARRAERRRHHRATSSTSTTSSKAAAFASAAGASAAGVGAGAGAGAAAAPGRDAAVVCIRGVGVGRRRQPGHDDAAVVAIAHDAAIEARPGAVDSHAGDPRSRTPYWRAGSWRAIQEDAHGAAAVAYLGHLDQRHEAVDACEGAGADIKVFGGGGGTILPSEQEEAHLQVARICSPTTDGRWGCRGWSTTCSRAATARAAQSATSLDVPAALEKLPTRAPDAIARLITAAENEPGAADVIGEAG